MDACPWRAIVDPASGNTYYAHAGTGETTWTRPAEMDGGAAVALPAQQTPSKRPPPPLPAAAATPTSSSPTSGSASVLQGAAAADGASFSPAPSSDSAAAAPLVDIAGTSWSKVLDPSSGKYYYANRVTFEVAWEEPAEVAAALLAAQMARQQLSSSTPLQRLIVPEEGETISLSSSVPVSSGADAADAAAASSSSSGTAPGHQANRSSSSNLYAAPVQDFGIEHEFHRVLDAASNNFYYVHKQTAAVQWNVPESWARVQALEAQLLREQAAPRGTHNPSKSWSVAPEVVPTAGSQAPRPATMRASAVPPPLPGSNSNGADAASPPAPQRKSSLSGRAPPPLPVASPASKTRQPPPPPPSYLSPQHATHNESGFFTPPGPQQQHGAHGEHRHSMSGSASVGGIGGLYSPTSPFMSPLSTPKVGGSSLPGPPPPSGPVSGPPPAPTLIADPMAGPPGGRQQVGPDGRPVLLLASIKNEIHNFGLKSFASAHFRTFKKRTGFVARTVVDVNELLSWQRECISKSLLTSTKKYSSDAVSLFKKILAFMGDTPEASKKNPALLAAEIVAIGVKNAPMRDEIYTQLCKQTKLNPEPLSTAAGWKLMALCCSNFAPTLAFQQTLMDYFVDNFAGAVAGSSSGTGSFGTASSTSSSSSGGGAALGAESTPSILSRYCHWKVGATISHGADEKLTLSTVDDMCARGVRSFQVLFPGSLDYIVHLQQAERNATSTAVPEIMVRMCGAIRDAGGFGSKGIFRIAAQREHVHAARARIEQGKWEVPADQKSDPHTPADVLKHWLRELQTPVVPMNLYEQALRVCDSEAEAVALCDQSLSPIHYATLDYLLIFLAELSTHEKVTAMTPDNLGIVFSQDLLRTDEKDPVMLYKNSAKEKAFVRTLITAWRNRLFPNGPPA